MEMEDYFLERRNGILVTLNSSKNSTVWGKKNLGFYELNSYKDFIKLKTTTSEMVSENPEDYVNGDLGDLKLTVTGGSTGKTKRIYYEMNTKTLLRFPDIIHNMINLSRKPVLLHQNKKTSTHLIYDENFPKIYPHSRVVKYNTPEEAVILIKDADLVYIEEAVSGFRRLVYSWEKIVESNKEIANILHGKIVLVELGADPITLKELSDLYQKLKNIFKTCPDIAITYGLTETQDVSIYVFYQRDSVLRYRVFDHKFLEVLDLKTGEPVVGRLGEILITPLYCEKGTILPRYRTGDVGSLEFIDNIPFLTISGRLPDCGVISFTGFKISIPGLCKVLREQFEYPFRLQARIQEKKDSTFGIMKITIYSPCFTNQSISEEIKTFLTKFIVREYGLDFDINQGYRKLDITTSTEDVGDKYWSILPKETIE